MGLNGILIVAAVHQELAPFQSVIPEMERKGLEVPTCLVVGMGNRCEAVLERELANRSYRCVVSIGLAGGLRPGFHVGDLVVASEVIDQTSGAKWVPSTLLGLNGLASVGPLLTVPSVLGEPTMKEKMGERYGAIAVDMETAVVARVAEKAGVGWASIRSILDPMEMALSVDSGWRSHMKLLWPRRWSELTGLMRAVRKSTRSLALGLRYCVERSSWGI